MRTMLAGALALLLTGGPAMAQSPAPLRVYAAGSLSGVMPKLVAGAGLPADTVLVFGPAGLLAKRIAGGEQADLFASADLAQPEAVAAASGAPVVPFARNRMCLLAPAALHVTPRTALATMLSPARRLATSTPGADPGGDYARAVFAKADALHPGDGAKLVAKAQMLMGAPGTMTAPPGHSVAARIIAEHRADIVLYYCSGTWDALKTDPSLASTPLPPSLEVDPVYGLTVPGGRAEADRLAVFMVSEKGQALLQQAGLLPLLAR